jgi:hypothetical protein
MVDYVFNAISVIIRSAHLESRLRLTILRSQMDMPEEIVWKAQM